jgi:hypothetical protein
MSRTLSPGENLHDFVGPFLPYSLLDTVVWLAHVISAGGMPMRPTPVSLNVENQDVEVFHTQRNPNLRRRSIRDGHTVHRIIGIPPAEITWANQTTVSKRLYGRKGPTKSCKFSPGDIVRLIKAKRMFKKGYLPNWTEELFTVVKCIEIWFRYISPGILSQRRPQ